MLTPLFDIIHNSHQICLFGVFDIIDMVDTIHQTSTSITMGTRDTIGTHSTVLTIATSSAAGTIKTFITKGTIPIIQTLATIEAMHTILLFVVFPRAIRFPILKVYHQILDCQIILSPFLDPDNRYNRRKRKGRNYRPDPVIRELCKIAENHHIDPSHY